MKLHQMFVLAATVALAVPPVALARDAARDLRKMVGYTIVDAAAVKEVSDATTGAGKILVLDNGDVYKVDFMILSPMTYTDVIVFAKRSSKEQLEAIRKKYPAFPEVTFKILIDNEAYDATLLGRR